MLPVLQPQPTRTEREARARARAQVVLARCLAEIAAAAGLEVEDVLNPRRLATPAARDRARLARQMLALWMRREFRISTRHIGMQLGLQAGQVYHLARGAERSLGSIMWAVEFLGRMKPAADEDAT